MPGALQKKSKKISGTGVEPVPESKGARCFVFIS
jgi:hypothetical protein